ncbi:MAG: TetR/AcrR family transcriptional regulator [Kiloniellales bacterium]
MARPREFSTEEALDKALQVFWSKGYEAASLCDLLEAMGISKSSFYDTFGSKHELLLAALERYRQTETTRMLDLLGGDSPAKQAIATAFARSIDKLTGAGARQGCFVNNCAVEISPHDPQAAKRVRECQASLEEAFFGAVERGQQAGDIPTRRDARALARFLSTSLAGLAVTAKGGAARAALEDAASITLQALD